jgi:ADP-ribose pyrophosphatase
VEPDLNARRTARLARYDELRRERPELFANPDGAAYEIVVDRAGQQAVANASAAALEKAGRPPEYGDIGVVYEDPYVIAVRDAVRFRDGRLGPYIRFLGATPGANAAVLPMLADGRLLLVRHFRHGLRTWQWEIPRGFADPDEDGVAAARRELHEEIGVRVDAVELLGRFAADAGMDELYLARIRADGVPVAAPDGAVAEGIDEIRTVTAADLGTMIADGVVTDAYLLAAYAFAVARKLI